MIAEWWANRSLDWSSGVMNPKPLSSLNHLTVPVGISTSPALSRAANAEIARGKGYDRQHCVTRDVSPTDSHTLAGAGSSTMGPGPPLRRHLAGRWHPVGPRVRFRTFAAIDSSLMWTGY